MLVCIDDEAFPAQDGCSTLNPTPALWVTLLSRWAGLGLDSFRFPAGGQ